MAAYLFPKPLEEGIIISRPNRFIMNVSCNGEIFECHCPSTGRIGNIDLNNTACLFSELANSKDRRTKYTVEAISLDSIDQKHKEWIGINQYRVNDYIEYFIRRGQLNGLVSKPISIRREVVLGKSRIDFLIDDTYIEIKTFLDTIPLKSNTKTRNIRKFISHERVIQHYKDLSIKTNSKILLCFLYKRDKLKSLFLPYYNEEIKGIVLEATKNGVETWQVNLSLDKKGITLISSTIIKMNEN